MFRVEYQISISSQYIVGLGGKILLVKLRKAVLGEQQ